MVEEEGLVDDALVVIEHGGEEFVAVAKHAAEVASRVFGDSDFGFGGHQVGTASGAKDVLEASDELFSGCGIEEETAPNAAVEGL